MANGDETASVSLETVLSRLDPFGVKLGLDKSLKVTIDFLPRTSILRVTQDVVYENGKLSMKPMAIGFNLREGLGSIFGKGEKPKDSKSLATKITERPRFPYGRWQSLAVCGAGLGTCYWLFGQELAAGTGNWARINTLLLFTALLASARLRDLLARLYNGLALTVGTVVIVLIAAQMLLPQYFPSWFGEQQRPAAPAKAMKKVPPKKQAVVPAAETPAR
jgi:hypothetical protein